MCNKRVLSRKRKKDKNVWTFQRGNKIFKLHKNGFIEVENVRISNR